MRIRTPFASVWVEDSIEAITPQNQLTIAEAATSSQTKKPLPQVRWANRTYVTSQGNCVAVKLHREQLYIAVRSPGMPLRWLRAPSVLTEAQAKEWLTWGFST